VTRHYQLVKFDRFLNRKNTGWAQIGHKAEKREITGNKKGLHFCKPFFKRFTKGLPEEKWWAVRDSNARPIG
jgi:hypothetical protein